MNKNIVPLLLSVTLATAALAADDSLRAEIEALKVQMAELKEAQSKVNYDALKRQIGEVKAHTGGDNIKWSVDFRTAYDYIDYKTTANKAMPGMPAGAIKAGKGHNGIWTNKLDLKMAAQPVDNLVFRGAISAYKTFGQNNVAQNSMFQTFDWYSSNKPSDVTIRLSEAYFIYFGEMGEMPYTASLGRRPSIDGFMTNLREDNERPSSPIGHNINMEFDGASFRFDFDKLTGVSGLYLKLCIGRGFSDATGSYSMTSNGMNFNPSYSKGSDNPNMDLVGLIIQAYNDGQYKVMANYFQAYNVMGIGMDLSNFGTGPLSMNGFHDVGDMTGGALSLQVDGIGDEISDFLDDTIFFASVAFSKTDPNNKKVNTGPASAMMGGQGMLGSQDKENGYSFYTGVNLPGFMEEDRFGLEYNYGSEYWRSFTYGEDTLAGSKLATRGSAYEVYYNLPLVGKNLTAQLRYTYMDYKHAGSDAFFGQSGNPGGMMGVMPYVESAQNIRAYLRYRY